jgi:hypothetical protein
MRNWRGKVSAGLIDRRPTVKQLVVSDWFAFDQVEYARNYRRTRNGRHHRRADGRMLATVRYFTFYLQEKGKLKSVFQDLQKLIPGSGSGEPAKNSIEILEDHLGKA